MGESLNVDDVVFWATWAFLQLGGRPGRSEDSPDPAPLLVSLVDVKIEHPGTDPFRPVRSGCIGLEGPLTKLPLCRNAILPSQNANSWIGKSAGNVFADVGTFPDSDTVYCLPSKSRSFNVAKFYDLLLKPSGISDRRGHYYRRGYFHIQNFQEGDMNVEEFGSALSTYLVHPDNYEQEATGFQRYRSSII